MKDLSRQSAAKYAVNTLAVLALTLASAQANDLQNVNFKSKSPTRYGNHISTSPRGGASCDCSQATLIDTQANVHYAQFPLSSDWNGTVGNQVEMPSASNPLQWNNNQRFNVDIQSNKVRIEFAADADYGQPASQFKFSLNPFAPAACGAANILSVIVTTNRTDAAPYVVPESSFSSTANTVTIVFGNVNGLVPFVHWLKGDWIEAQLEFGCEETPPPSSPPPCCPPWNQETLESSLYMIHTGSISDPYYIEFNPSQTLENQMQAYINYVGAIGACSNLVLSFMLSDFQGNPPLNGMPPGHTNWYVPNSERWVKWEANGGTGAIYSSFYGPSMLLNVGTWYRIGTGMYCEPEDSFFGEECAVISYVDFRVQVQGAMKKGRSSTAAVLQIRGKDGKVVSKPIRTRRGKPASIWNARKGSARIR